jgi:hypothetical protein
MTSRFGAGAQTRVCQTRARNATLGAPGRI